MANQSMFGGDISLARQTNSQMPNLVKKDTQTSAALKRDFLAEMGAFDQPSTLTDAEKSNLQAQKDQGFEDQIGTYNEQLTNLRQDMVKSRKVIDDLFKGMEDYHTSQRDLFQVNVDNMKKVADHRLQVIQNNMMLHSGHTAYRLSEARVWSPFTLIDPLKLMKISNEEQYVLTTNESTFDFLELDQHKGFKKVGKLDTDNNKVFSACLLNSGLQGVAISNENAAADGK